MILLVIDTIATKLSPLTTSQHTVVSMDKSGNQTTSFTPSNTLQSLRTSTNMSVSPGDPSSTAPASTHPPSNSTPNIPAGTGDPSSTAPASTHPPSNSTPNTPVGTGDPSSTAPASTHPPSNSTPNIPAGTGDPSSTAPASTHPPSNSTPNTPVGTDTIATNLSPLTTSQHTVVSMDKTGNQTTSFTPSNTLQSLRTSTNMSVSPGDPSSTAPASTHPPSNSTPNTPVGTGDSLTTHPATTTPAPASTHPPSNSTPNTPVGTGDSLTTHPATTTPAPASTHPPSNSTPNTPVGTDTIATNLSPLTTSQHTVVSMDKTGNQTTSFTPSNTLQSLRTSTNMSVSPGDPSSTAPASTHPPSNSTPNIPAGTGDPSSTAPASTHPPSNSTPNTPVGTGDSLTTHPATTTPAPASTHPPSNSTPNTPVGTDITSNKTSATTQPPSNSTLNTPASTGSSSKECQYSINAIYQENTKQYEVNVKVENKVQNQNYSVILKNSSGGTIQEMIFNGTVYNIPFSILKPCETYTVSLDHNCTAPDKNNTILTKPWIAELPVVNFTRNIESKFKWTNKPEECSETATFRCTFNENNEFNENQTVYLEPYRNDTCTVMYPSGNFTRNFSVSFTCDLNKSEANVTVNNKSIDVQWNLTSSNCDNTKFTYTVTCETSTQNKVVHKTCSEEIHSKKLCTVEGLTYDDKYKCKFKAMYDDRKINYEHEKEIKTPSGQPKIHGLQTKNLDDNNAFQVTFSIEWNGKPRECCLKLNIDKPICNDTKINNCSFNLMNLYYFTNYTITVYAKNAGNITSVSVFTSHSTRYNYNAVFGFLVILIIITSLALLFVMYKIFNLQRRQSREVYETDHLLPLENLLHVEPISGDALVETYRKKIADEGRLFMEEFQSIPRIFSNYTVKEAKKAENQTKNRYVDILPYDYNRVSLSSGGKHDYINASFIEGYKESNKYIAAQGPKEETVEDFWRMVWEQKSSIIVMVTRCEEGNKNKCAQYWPSMERETEIFEDFVVKIKLEEKCPDYIIRQLSLMNRKEKTAERDVTHIQFMSWPDHGVPGDPGLLLKLRRRVNSFKNIFSGPIVVHCSAGVGRTGTYIGIDAMIESLESEGRVDIYGYVAKLRRQRCLMVQVEAQYVLIHTALIEYNQFGETEIPLTDFHSAVHTLKQKEGNEPSLLELEYHKLPRFKHWRLSNTAGSEENKKKNRSSIVPYDYNRVLVKLEEEDSRNSDGDDEEEYSSDEDDETTTKYINASYVDGYWCPKSLITAQGPLDNTVEDFLRMLHQKQVPAVVMLSDCTENDKEFCIQYWAEEKRSFGEMEVEVKETESTPTYIRRHLQIRNTKGKESLMTEQYHFLKWAGHELPANPLDLIDMMRSIRLKVGPGNNANAPIVVHCNDGSSRSGIFCTLWKLLDSADTEKLVDVFQMAKSMRKERLGMFTTLEQYQFLYEALQAAFPVQNGEVKKTIPSHDTVQVINEENGTTNAGQKEAAKSQTPENQAVAPPENQAVTPPENQAVTPPENQAVTPPENQAVTPPENQAVEKPDTASPSSEEGSSESSSVPEKAPSESTTNGPSVNVDI
ncbi:receptor-type tyrosine-protein phosphatase C isoform X35 [Brachyhypopomus gauderio]|uniref:receptor-type tyrosine-protein phosphatase C isoform X35 n=1 Tax=Brachyhypopomus gauderio TaxID=698409 RepID=UPI00404329AF